MILLDALPVSRVSGRVLMKKQPIDGLVQPMSMEDKARYIWRFLNHKGMIAIFNDSTQRCQVAEQIFATRWENAQVTVRKLNGEMFFID